MAREIREQAATTFLLEKRKYTLGKTSLLWSWVEFHLPQSLLEGFPYFKRNLADKLAILHMIRLRGPCIVPSGCAL